MVGGCTALTSCIKPGPDHRVTPWASGNQSNIFTPLGGDGTINGVLTDNVLDTTRLFSKVNALSTATTRVDTAFNAATFKITPTTDANPLGREGLR